jgi:hypothetical protein
MHSSTMQRGPLAPWVRGDAGQEMSQYAQRGQEALMSSMSDVEHFLDQNATAVCVAGIVLGTFVDRRFYLLPLALGGMRLWRSLQQ